MTPLTFRAQLGVVRRIGGATPSFEGNREMSRFANENGSARPVQHPKAVSGGAAEFGLEWVAESGIFGP